MLAVPTQESIQRRKSVTSSPCARRVLGHSHAWKIQNSLQWWVSDGTEHKPVSWAATTASSCHDQVSRAEHTAQFSMSATPCSHGWPSNVIHPLTIQRCHWGCHWGLFFKSQSATGKTAVHFSLFFLKLEYSVSPTKMHRQNTKLWVKYVVLTVLSNRTVCNARYSMQYLYLDAIS